MGIEEFSAPLGTCRKIDAMISQQAPEAGAAVLTDDLKGFRKVKGLKVMPLR